MKNNNSQMSPYSLSARIIICHLIYLFLVTYSYKSEKSFYILLGGLCVPFHDSKGKYG